MVKWGLFFSKSAQKDSVKIDAAGLRGAVEALLELLSLNPFTSLPPYEKVLGDMRGARSRRINIQHRLVYQVDEKRHEVRILRMWAHYK